MSIHNCPGTFETPTVNIYYHYNYLPVVEFREYVGHVTRDLKNYKMQFIHFTY